MTLEDMIRRFRVAARDTVEPFLFPTEDVTDWLNDAQDQACVRGRLLREDALPEMCRIVLEAGKHTYKLHQKLYEISHLRVLPQNGGRSRHLLIKTREWLDAEMPDWRDSNRPAMFAIQDDISLRVVGKVDDGDVLALECYRLPLKPMEADNSKPEIHIAHHDHLIQWALHRAFSIPDAEMFDAQRAEKAEREFSSYFGLMPDADMRRITRHDVAHHNATFLP